MAENTNVDYCILEFIIYLYKSKDYTNFKTFLEEIILKNENNKIKDETKTKKKLTKEKNS